MSVTVVAQNIALDSVFFASEHPNSTDTVCFKNLLKTYLFSSSCPTNYVCSNLTVSNPRVGVWRCNYKAPLYSDSDMLRRLINCRIIIMVARSSVARARLQLYLFLKFIIIIIIIITKDSP